MQRLQGDANTMIELGSPGVRRIEVPVLVDRRGTVRTAGLIDVSVRHQERVVLAESPPPELSAELAASLKEAAARLAGARGGVGAFTVSFLAEPSSDEHRFLGTAPGLPKGVAVLEALDEVDLAALEAHLTRGGTLDGQPAEPRGCALQVCLSALDPEDGFAPSPGVVEALRLPAGPGLRADPEVNEGETPAEGAEIVRVTAHGRTRAEALDRLQRGLARTEVSLRDGGTDKAFLAEVLDRPELTSHEPADPDWLNRLVASGEHLPRRGAEAALLASAISSYEAKLDAARDRFFASAVYGRPEVPEEIGRDVELRYRGQDYLLRVARLDWRRFRVEVDGVRLEMLAERPGRTGRTIACGERSWRIALAVHESWQIVEVDGIPHRIERDAKAAVRSRADERRARVRFETLVVPEDGAASGRRESLREMRRLMLGYDADAEILQSLLAAPATAEADRPLEEEILRAFADVPFLFRHHPADEIGDGRHSVHEILAAYLRDLDAGGEGLPASFLAKLERALAHYGVSRLGRSPELEEGLFRIVISNRRLARQVPPVLAVLEGWLDGDEAAGGPAALRELLDRLIAETQGSEPAVHDLAREVRYRRFDRPVLLAVRERIYAAAEEDLERLAADPGPEERAARIRALVECPQPLHLVLSRRYEKAGAGMREALLEVMVRRYYRIRELRSLLPAQVNGQLFAVATYEHRGSHVHLVTTHAGHDRLAWSVEAVRRLAADAAPGSEIVADLYFWRSGRPANEDDVARQIADLLASSALPVGLRRVAVVISGAEGAQIFTFRRSESDGDEFREERVYRDIHPMLALRLELWRLQNFHLERLPAPERVYFFHGVARENPRDERLFAVAEVRDLTPVRDEAGRVVELPQLEHMLMEALTGIRRFQSRRAVVERLQWNRVLLNLWPPVDLRPAELDRLVRRLVPLSEGLGLEKVAVRCRIPDESGELQDRVLEISSFEEAGAVLRFRKPSEAPLKPLREYAQKVVDLRRRGLPYPYEVVKRLAPPRRDTQADVPAGDFVEHDLDAEGRLVPVERPYGQNTAAVVVGIVRNYTLRHPEGMARVILLGDASRGMGALAEPECRRILAALDLAAAMRVPVEWFALSAGARISMEDGTEAMDWIGRVLRRLVELTQNGLEVNVVVAGLNAGPQPYWNAEATMLMHTRGILIMTPESAMVLTGKRALDGSGGVSVEDNQELGGYERIMGPNGQAQYFVHDLGEACRLLHRYYDRAYVAPDERFPRPWPTGDPRERDVREFPHGGELKTVGDVFSPLANPGRKKPFEIRKVMEAVADQDHPPLERWYGMRDAEIAVVWDVCLGGHPVCLLGFESKPLPRLGSMPGFGPEQWTAGTLFPLAAKKVARAVNAASGNRPLVVLANLSGFDGSPESMRFWQLEYGAEIGRAVVNFQGPIVFCVISRYHGGAFMIFSSSLNDNLEVAALEGSYASVIGGAPAAAVALSREVDQRTRQDSRIVELEKAIADAERADKARLRASLDEALAAVRSEKLSAVAAEFDAVHSIERAQRVGSVHHIVAPERLRPYLIEAVERGMEKALAGGAASARCTETSST
ncbi:MAG TPA: carboxyl transferase domain-containing protein [Thermoanaerobaculia bacterium]